MNILVTGGLGFVGVNIVRCLAETEPEAQLIAADLLEPDAVVQSFLAPVAERVVLVRLDVTNRDAVQSLMVDSEITTVVHAAAITPSIERERAAPTPIVDVNLGSAVHVLEAAIRWRLSGSC